MTQLGVIEGYYGKPWSWPEREDTMRFLAGFGYEFYLYAPKADPHLRRLWREPHPDDVAQQITLITRANQEQSLSSANMLQVLTDVRKLSDQESRGAAEISTLSSALVERARAVSQGGTALPA